MPYSPRKHSVHETNIYFVRKTFFAITQLLHSCKLHTTIDYNVAQNFNENSISHMPVVTLTLYIWAFVSGKRFNIYETQ